MSNFNIMGSYSGIDMSVIDQMIEAERSKGVQFTNRKDKIEREQGAWKDVGKRLNSLIQKTDALKQRSTFESKKVNSTAGNNSAVSVTAGNNAPIGNYQLKVDRLATSTRLVGGKIDIEIKDSNKKPIDQSLGLTESFNFRNAEGKSFQVKVSNEDSLRDITRNINAQTKESGIEASIVDNRLILKDTQMGDRALSIESNGTAEKLGFGSAATGNIIGTRLTGHKMDPSSIKNLNDQTITIGDKDIKFENIKNLEDIANQINAETLTKDQNGNYTGIAASISNGHLVLTDMSNDLTIENVTGDAEALEILGFTERSITHTGTEINLDLNVLSDTFTIGVGNQNIEIDSNKTIEEINDAFKNTDIQVTKKGNSLIFTSTAEEKPEISIIVNQEKPTSESFKDIDIADQEDGGAYLTSGQSAKFTVDGLLIERDDNRISDAIEGIVFTLKSEHTDNTSEVISITNDTQKAVDAMKEFVEQYNSVMNFIQTQTDVGTPGEDNNSVGALVGEGSIIRLQSGLRTTLMQRINGKSIADFGVEIDRYGVATLDESKLNEALLEDPTSLSRFFYRPELELDGSGDVPQGQEPKDTKGMADLFNNFLEAYTSKSKGIIATKNDSYDRMVKQINEQIETFNERIDRKRDRYIKQFAALDEAMMRAESQMQYLWSQMNIE